MDGTVRFAESISVLHFFTVMSSYKQYIHTALLEAAHTNVCPQVFYQSLLLTYESLQERTMVKLCLNYARSHCLLATRSSAVAYCILPHDFKQITVKVIRRPVCDSYRCLTIHNTVIYKVILSMVSGIISSSEITVKCSEFTLHATLYPHASFHMYVTLIASDSLHYVQH